MKFWQRFNKNTFRGIAAALVVAAAVMGGKAIKIVLLRDGFNPFHDC